MKDDSNKVIDADNEAWIELRDDIDDEVLIGEIPHDDEAMFEEICAHEDMYQKATRQCNVLRSALSHPDCDEETRQVLISTVKDILDYFSDAGEKIKETKERIYAENPDFFPKRGRFGQCKKSTSATLGTP